METSMSYKEYNFKMELEYLKDEMFNDYNNERLVWYYTTFDKDERLLHEIDWQIYIIDNEENIIFFSWLELYCIKKNIAFSFREKVEQTTNINKTYVNIKTKESITSLSLL